MTWLRWRLGRFWLDVQCFVSGHDWTAPFWCEAGNGCRYCCHCGITEHEVAS